MRKIIATEFFTLDGLMSDPKDQMDWVTSNFSEDIGKYEDDLYDNADTLLLGRVTYKIFESYWPSAATNPSTPKDGIEMAHKINSINKIVFSNTLENVGWENTTLVKEIIPQEIIELKRQPGRNMLIVGSASITQQFANLGLIDEFHLLIHPIILGSGKSLFNNIKDRVDLKLLKTREFESGVILLTYMPAQAGYLNKKEVI